MNPAAAAGAALGATVPPYIKPDGAGAAEDALEPNTDPVVDAPEHD